MSKDPILVLQLQRMGDLIMTFPLMLDLGRLYPEHPIWVVAEPVFFTHIMPFAPSATFFPPSAMLELAEKSYRLVINLSSRPDAAFCVKKARAEIRLGPSGDNSGLKINGFWQLYRAALTDNNRHNLFHWADLFRLDIAYPLPVYQWKQVKGAGTGRIALFTGASEVAKKPDAEFWVSLARRLSSAGFTPFLLGGPAEKDFGQAIARRAQVPDFCGKTDLRQLAALVSSADLFVTPDTGPMHLANWLGVPVFNISLGNVAPWETGPVSASQWVAQAAISCAGCWKCRHRRQLCRHFFSPQGIARILQGIMKGEKPIAAQGLKILQTGRSANGLYLLSATGQQARASASDLLGFFWQAAFLSFSGMEKKDAVMLAAANLAESFPCLCANMAGYFTKLLCQLGSFQKKRAQLPKSFWRNHPWHTSLFAGHCQMWLQNAGYSQNAWQQIMGRLVMLGEIFAAYK